MAATQAGADQSLQQDPGVPELLADLVIDGDTQPAASCRATTRPTTRTSHRPRRRSCGDAPALLALASSQVPVAGAVLHEPAVGTLVPGLLDHVVAGYAAGGVEGLGRALYGPGWSLSMAPRDPDLVARDLAMFRAFDPQPLATGQENVVVTVGADSPPLRHEAARVLHDRLGVEVRVLPGCRHFVQHDEPARLAALIRDVAARTQGRRS